MARTRMARTMLRIGGWYLVYEAVSTLAIVALVAWGVRFPGF